MRKLQQVAIVAAAAGGLSAIGAGAGVAYAHGGGGPKVVDNFRPYQECSPQTFAEANVPIGALAVPQTWGTTCGQFNHAFTG
ncbi:hypothetical protein SSP35_09_00410 [Streptomyces sp. NBRC 110611]|uniref:hypothetical protein n=1 Tax=Streptomyces sp. NBRC 110611 TaxID=1621259 RepID=UPI000832A8CA|nr:hypothetical protein [Streptomyces sp. NBRC 110611]GAU68798.1 hypothetical protein SSP35_09_00410 [Streptomyces sp. NBRC 110611]